MVPENVARIYRMLWESRALKQIEKEQEIEADIDKQEVYHNVAEALKQDLYTGSRLTPELAERYEKEKPRMGLTSWLKEQELQKHFEDRPLPGPEWLGWDSRVDLEDVKLKVVKNEGLDYHDFNLWDTRERAILRKPYVEEAVETMDEERNPEEVRRQIRSLVAGYGLKDVQIDVSPSTQPKTQTNLQISHDKDHQLSRWLERREHGERLPVRRKTSSRPNRRETPRSS
jgi:hypothetical protein